MPGAARTVRRRTGDGLPRVVQEAGIFGSARRARGAAWLRDRARAAGVVLLQQLQSRPAAVRGLLVRRWFWLGACLLWLGLLVTPPALLCHLPEGTRHPSPSAMVFFRASSLASWHAESALDPEFFVHRLVSSLPLATDPASLARHGAAVLCRNGEGTPFYNVVQEEGSRGPADLFAALDTDGTGHLERPEVWQLQGMLKSWFVHGNDVAEQVSQAARDERGRLSLTAFQGFWSSNLSSEHQRFVVVNGSLEAPENEDEAASLLAHSYRYFIPVGRVEAVATDWSLQWVGSIACALVSEPFGVLGEVLFLIVTILGVFLLCDRVAPQLDLSPSKRQALSFAAASCWSLLDPVGGASRALYVSPMIGKALTMLLMLSNEECQQVLARLEYLGDAQDDLGAGFASSRGSDDPLVRCPLCRRLSLSSQVVQKVHGDIRREPCCVCLNCDSEVCFTCGHLCMCTECFQGLAASRRSTPGLDGLLVAPNVVGAPDENGSAGDPEIGDGARSELDPVDLELTRLDQV
ncbi:unnamed protein product [Prorocentrum cordatum]|uniref:EF-hand domain-containing protein n=1 Tax=Prorocentrum cordatum TaxID=2364126 RepID=A0ABN9V274_9DINO|nr:unnamed protein product [Polarella glacialis]